LKQAGAARIALLDRPACTLSSTLKDSEISTVSSPITYRFIVRCRMFSDVFFVGTDSFFGTGAGTDVTSWHIRCRMFGTENVGTGENPTSDKHPTPRNGWLRASKVENIRNYIEPE
jgi:hypothetical protein